MEGENDLMLFFIFVFSVVFLILIQHIVDKNAISMPYWQDEKDDARTFFQKKCNKLRNSELVILAWGSTLVVSIICLVISIVFFGINYIGASSYKASLLEEQRILTYQIENKFYENDIEYGKNELFRDITEFNAFIQGHRELTKDFWVGIYMPNIYDDIPLVELPSLEAS